jgi:hypothetical protein
VPVAGSAAACDRAGLRLRPRPWSCGPEQKPRRTDESGTTSPRSAGRRGGGCFRLGRRVRPGRFTSPSATLELRSGAKAASHRRIGHHESQIGGSEVIPHFVSDPRARMLVTWPRPGNTQDLLPSGADLSEHRSKSAKVETLVSGTRRTTLSSGYGVLAPPMAGGCGDWRGDPTGGPATASTRRPPRPTPERAASTTRHIANIRCLIDPAAPAHPEPVVTSVHIRPELTTPWSAGAGKGGRRIVRPPRAPRPRCS